MTSFKTVWYRLIKGDLAIIFYFSVFRVLLHFAVNLFSAYGIFRDELYYLACADHPAMGYVDQPPVSVLLLKVWTLIFGDSLFSIRMVPALAGGATVFLTGLLVKRMGGEKFAQFLACLCSFSFITIAMDAYYSMNSIDILIWAVVNYLVVIIYQTGNKRVWIMLGVVLGIGLMNKISVLFLGAGLFAGILFTPMRKWLTTPWPYVAGLIAFVLFLPYIIWNLQNDLAHLEFIHNASGGKYAQLTALSFIRDQFLINNPVASVVWILALYALALDQQLKPYRILLFLFVVPLLILMINGTSKAEYLAAAYVSLWPVGSIWIERKTASKKIGNVLRIILPLLISVQLLMLLPMVINVLPVDRYIAYADLLGFEPSSSEGKELADLPQFYADMFGWKEKAETVALVYDKLSPEEKEKCAIFSTNYGRCGAIDYYGRAYHLPKSIGNHNNYWIWGPRNYTGEIMIIVGGSMEDHIGDFDQVTKVSVATCNHCMPYENNVSVFLCRGLKKKLSEIWLEEKHFE